MRQVQNSEYCRVIVRIRERTVPLANFDLIDRLGFTGTTLLHLAI